MSDRRSKRLSKAATLALILNAGVVEARQQERTKESSAPGVPADAQPVQVPIAGYDDGFFIQSPDGAFRFTLGGLLQVRGTAFERGLEGRTSQFDLERMRFELAGSFYERYLFNVEPKFTESEVELEEAWVGTDLAEDGPRLMFGRMKELSGPAAISAEAIRVEEDLSGSSGDVRSDTTGWYVAASWVLTGEQKSFRGVNPSHPLGGPSSGRGAWQLALRYSDLDLDEALVEGGLVTASSFPESVGTWDVGLNWYTTAHTKVMLHFLHTDYEQDIVIQGDSRGSESAVLLQFQMHF
jgi:phosphate-selective porin